MSGLVQFSWAGTIFLFESLGATFLISRILLWAIKNWRGIFDQIVAANCLSILICGLVYLILPSNGYNINLFPDFAAAFVVFFLPQGIWILVDTLLAIRRLSEHPA